MCGLVAESHVIDESSEWRTFADSVSLSQKQQIDSLSHVEVAGVCFCTLSFVISETACWQFRTSPKQTARVLEGLQILSYQKEVLVPLSLLPAPRRVAILQLET